MTTPPFIYSVREPRCGGSHAIESIKILYRDTNHNKKQLEFIDTHDMSIIRNVKPEENALVIRCDRKNLVDHFFSVYFLRYLPNFTNVRFFEGFDIPVLQEAFEKRIVVNEAEVQSYLGERIRTHASFLKNTRNLKSQTIYYEDWHKKFDIPSLGLYNIDLSTNFQYTKKLPEYKRTVFVNYDETVKWIQKYKNDYLKEYNLTQLFEHWQCNPSG